MTFIEILLEIVLPFLGGLGMFLYGMKLMSDNLEKIAGNKLRNMLDIITKNRIVGMAVGMVFTMIVQSSSATTVMVVGFVNAGLMNLIQATSVIMGANIGTTITAQLVAFKLTKIAPLIVFIGVIMVFFIRRQKTKDTGSVLVGFGILFLGMASMSGAMEPLREMDAFISILSTFENPFLGVMSGAILTGIIQSSSASMGILLAMATQNLIGLEGALYIILGFNIGTCITAVLAVIGANKTAKRAATVHFMFNLLGSLIFVALVQIFPIVQWMEALSDDPVRQMANFHTIFNISMTIFLLPFAGILVMISKKLIQGEDSPKEPMKLMFIEDHMFATPTVVTAQFGLEIDRMANLAKQNIHDSITAFMTENRDLVDIVYDREQVVDFLNHEISEKLVKANQMDLSEHDSEYISRLFHVVSDLERISDHAENIIEFTVSRIERGTKYSEKAMDELTEYSAKVFEILDLSMVAFNDQDNVLAMQGVENLEDEIDAMEKKLRKRHIKRLKKQECNARAGTIFIDILSNLERVADHATNIASAIVGDD